MKLSEFREKTWFLDGSVQLRLVDAKDLQISAAASLKPADSVRLAEIDSFPVEKIKVIYLHENNDS